MGSRSRNTPKLRSPDPAGNRKNRRAAKAKAKAKAKAPQLVKHGFDAGAGHGPDFDFRGEPPEFTEHFYGYGHRGD